MTKALIIGSGIAGPAAAVAFAKAGIDAEIFEKYPRPADEAGVFFTLGSNGIDALSTLGLGDDVLAHGFPTPAIELRSGTGKRLGESRIGPAQTQAPVSQTMRRSDLYGILRDRALADGIPIRYDKQLVDVVETPDGVVATFADGSTAHGDLVVGCDGIRSAVRTVIDPSAPAPASAGLINYGGYTSGVAVDGDAGTFRMIFGARAFFGYAIAPDRTVWWFVNEPTGSSTAEPPRRDDAALRRHLGALFVADAGPAAELIAAGHDLASPTRVELLPHLPHWHRGRIVVIGDAAHAPSPSSGQGASLSIEDALVIAQCVRDLGPTTAAFARFEESRRGRVEAIAKTAARINNNKAATGMARRMRDVILPIALALGGTRGLDEVYGHHIDWSQNVALQR